MKLTQTPLVFICLVLSLNVFATHNRSGEIQYKRLAPFTNSNYTYSITVIKYFDEGPGIADRCVDTVYFGDGTKGIASRVNGLSGSCCGAIPCGELIVNDLAYKVKMSKYSIIHTYAGTGSYVISSRDLYRTAGIDNIPNSTNQAFYLEATMNITPTVGENTSPILSRPPIDRGLVNQCFYHNACVYDLDGDSLSYELIACKVAATTNAPGYTFPPVTSGGSFNLDQVTGLITWCMPPTAGVYQIAFLVKEWRKSVCNGIYQQIGYVERDMEIIISTGPGTSFSTSIINGSCTRAGATVSANISGTFSTLSAGPALLYGYSQDPENLSIATITSVITPSLTNSTINTNISWPLSCILIPRPPQTIYIVYTASGGVVPLTFYRQFEVKTIAPPPKITSLQTGVSMVTLNWMANTTCNNTISAFRLYRKFGSSNWAASICTGGIPAASGYSYIATATPTQTAYTDTDLYTIPNGTNVYYLLTTVYNNCQESPPDSAQVLNLVVGLNKNTMQDKIVLFPNPGKDFVEIQREGKEITDFEITFYASDGKIIRQENRHLSGQLIRITTNDLSEGLYIITVRDGQQTHYLKWMKQ